MKIGIIAPPFIAVPPARYGGTELFVAHLARALHEDGHQVIVYANGESELPCEVRWLHPTADWPIVDAMRGSIMQCEHVSWAIADAQAEGFDVLHLNDATALHFTRFADAAYTLTLHHPHEPTLSELYATHPEVQYVAISASQAQSEYLPNVRVIHHGVDLTDYRLSKRPRSYLAFIGRIAPCKGVREAIDVAKRAGIPLKLAGEIQPIFMDYWRDGVAPHVDGTFIEYIGEADLAGKNELLAGARALLFPIQWDEPFGLVMIEAMACGTPVLGFARGSVPEVVDNGVTGWICRDVDDMASAACTVALDPVACRRRAVQRFSVERMAREYEQLYVELTGTAALAS